MQEEEKENLSSKNDFGVNEKSRFVKLTYRIGIIKLCKCNQSVFNPIYKHFNVSCVV